MLNCIKNGKINETKIKPKFLIDQEITRYIYIKIN